MVCLKVAGLLEQVATGFVDSLNVTSLSTSFSYYMYIVMSGSKSPNIGIVSPVCTFCIYSSIPNDGTSALSQPELYCSTSFNMMYVMLPGKSIKMVFPR